MTNIDIEKISSNELKINNKIYAKVPIGDFGDRYYVCRDGEVFDIVKNKTVTCTIINSPNGKFSKLRPYKQLSLFYKGKQKTLLLHKLVAAVYLGPKPEGHSGRLRFIDNDSLNCSADNLRWSGLFESA